MSVRPQDNFLVILTRRFGAGQVELLVGLVISLLLVHDITGSRD